MADVSPSTGPIAEQRLPTPAALRALLPAPADVVALVAGARRAIRDILAGRDDRLLAIVGPCSIHELAAARTYAAWLAGMAARHREDLLLVMRVYVEKPRTRHGWKGLVHDPRLDDSADVVEGLRLARQALLDVNRAGVAAATEFVHPLIPPYLIDLVSWTAIGARTVESPVHRWMASGWPCPVGFKNATSGSVDAAIDAALVAREPHRALTIDESGAAVVRATPGNPSVHLVLRGGSSGANHTESAVTRAMARQVSQDLTSRLVIDCAHGNAAVGRSQVDVAAEVADQIAGGQRAIAGLLCESYLVAGRQDLAAGRALVSGQSITDACLDLDETARVLEMLAAARIAGLARRTAAGS